MSQLDAVAPHFAMAARRWGDAANPRAHYEDLARTFESDGCSTTELAESFIESVCITVLTEFVRQLDGYFTRTATGRYRTAWIVPTPFFVASDMTYPVQAADLCIYCLNWGFRLPSQGMNAAKRDEIGDEFGPWLNQLQFAGEGSKDGRTFNCWGIVYVQNPYAPGRT